jgi:hypothetical protein
MSRQYFGDPGHRPGCRAATHDPDWTVHRAIASYLSKEPTFDGVTVAKLAAALGYPEQQIDGALWVLGNGGEAELGTRHPYRAGARQRGHLRSQAVGPHAPPT